MTGGARAQCQCLAPLYHLVVNQGAGEDAEHGTVIPKAWCGIVWVSWESMTVALLYESFNSDHRQRSDSISREAGGIKSK